MDEAPRDRAWLEDDLYFEKCRLAEAILDDLIAETARECKRVFAIRDKDKAESEAKMVYGKHYVGNES